jgi:ABC-type oligopeptide transport system substrate-binding subunit
MRRGPTKDPPTMRTRRLAHAPLAALLLTALFAVAGCGGDNSSSEKAGGSTASSETPEQAVANAIETNINDQVNGNVAKACAGLTTAYAKKQYGADCESGLKKSTKNIKDYLDTSSIKATAVKVNGDTATATMVFSLHDPNSNKTAKIKTTFTLTKVDGQWKLSGDNGGKEVK